MIRNLEEMIGMKWNVKELNAYSIREKCVSDFVHDSKKKLSEKHWHRVQLLEDITNGKHVEYDEAQKILYKNTRRKHQYQTIEEIVIEDVIYAWHAERINGIKTYQNVLENYNPRFAQDQIHDLLGNPIKRLKNLKIGELIIPSLSTIIIYSLMISPTGVDASMFPYMTFLSGCSLIELHRIKNTLKSYKNSTIEATDEFDRIWTARKNTHSCLQKKDIEEHLNKPEQYLYLTLDDKFYTRLHLRGKNLFIDTIETPRKEFERYKQIIPVMAFASSQLMINAGFKSLLSGSNGRAKFLKKMYSNKVSGGRYVILENWKFENK